MRDKISEQRLQLLHPVVRDRFKAFIEESEETFNITLRIVQGLRTIEEQNALYAQGRTKPGKIVTKAKGGSSYHNYGLAVDLGQLHNGAINWNFKYELLLPLAMKYGLVWGGTFKSIVDKPHYEYSVVHWKKLLERYNRKEFIPGTKYLNLT